MQNNNNPELTPFEDGAYDPALVSQGESPTPAVTADAWPQDSWQSDSVSVNAAQPAYAPTGPSGFHSSTVTTVVGTQPLKDPGLAAILGFLFGPLGLLYSGIVPAVIMFFIAWPVILITVGFGIPVLMVTNAVIGYVMAKKHNETRPLTPQVVTQHTYAA